MNVKNKEKKIGLFYDAWVRLKKHKLALIGLFILSFYFILAILAPVLPFYSYQAQTLEHQNLHPSLTKNAGQLMIEAKTSYLSRLMVKEERTEYTEREKEELADLEKYVLENPEENQRKYFLGTDALGRDLLSRVVYGSQVSIAIGLLGAIISVIIGVIIGSIAGYVGGRTDYLLMRLVDVMYGLPYMLIVIILMAVLGRNISNLFIALSFVSWLTTARVVRGQILSLRNSLFVEAARSMGASTSRIIFRHLIPNTLGVIIIYTTLRVPTFILMESFLSFLGLGISAPYASWGSLIQDGINSMEIHTWKLFFPAVAMTLFLFATNFLGDGLRDAFDPQSKNKV